MNMTNVRMMARYNAWANKRMYEAVAVLPPGEALKERNPSERNYNFKNIVHALNHNYVIDLIWQAHLEGRDHGFNARNTSTYPPQDELAKLQQAMDDWYIRYSDALPVDKLQENVTFTLVGGNKGVMTREAILLHIVNHCTYHRGFIAMMFYQIPVSPPMMDLPVYFREHRA